MTVYDPKVIDRLDRYCSQGLCLGTFSGGYAKRLAERCPGFDLNDTTKSPFYFPHRGPMTLQAGFAIFDPFFFELRYPGELTELDSVGRDDVWIFQSLVGAIQPFTKSIP